MDEPVDLTPTTDQLSRIVTGIGDDELGRPSPSPGRNVGDLLDHCLGLALAFTCGARKEPVPGPDGPPPTPSAANLPGDWRAELPARLQTLADAWRDPAASEGMTRVGGVTMPGAVMRLVALDEVFLHGWDLAVSTGQPFEPDEAAVPVVHGFLAESTKDNPEGTPGLFGPVVPIPEDSPLLDQVLGLSGRAPGWAPAAAT